MSKTGRIPSAPSRRRVTAILSAVIMVALAAAGWSGWSWYSAAFGGQARVAANREAALNAGERGLVTFSSLDHRNADAGLDRWARSATGPLLDGLHRGRAQNADEIRQAGTATTGKVLSRALTDIDVRSGHATMIGVVEVVVTPSQGQPATKRNRLRAELTRTPDGWKLSGLGPIPVEN